MREFDVHRHRAITDIGDIDAQMLLKRRAVSENYLA
jgi:hypothetical protein